MFKVGYINGRSVLAGILAISCALHTSSALGEFSIKDISHDVINSAPFKDNPEDRPKYELNGDTITVRASALDTATPTVLNQDVVENEEKNERKMFNSAEEFLAYRDMKLDEGWRKLLARSAEDENDLAAKIELFNCTLYSLCCGSCVDIDKDVAKNGNFAKNGYNSFFFTAFSNSFQGFAMLSRLLVEDATMGKYSLNLSIADLIYDDGDRELFSSLNGPVEDVVAAYRKNKGKVVEKLKEEAQVITSGYEKAMESDDLPTKVYVALPSSRVYNFLAGETTELKNGKTPDINSNYANEVGRAVYKLNEEISDNMYYEILALTQVNGLSFGSTK